MHSRKGKIMRKIVLCLVFLFAISNVVIPVNAQEIRTKVGEGYTSEGIYYEIYINENLENKEISMCGTSIYVTREVVYSGIVTPQKTISWREKISGTYYSGTLSICKFGYTSTQTEATYSGTLYEE